jgi:hypothetical protein
MSKGIFRKHFSHGIEAEPRGEEQTSIAAANEITVEAVARRAYERWVERGCPEGSPEVDWFGAEQELGIARASTEEAAPGPRIEVETGARAAG